MTVPESYRCTGWRLLRRGDGSEQISVCASVESIPGRQFISESNEHFYETINLGDEHSRTLRAPARQYAEVLVDGQSVGQRYYAD
ncbi:MAG: hypothetical protein IJ228_12265 [Succinivibrio sp.]|nr:hypothetical protein [Succinivibrio sp.]